MSNNYVIPLTVPVSSFEQESLEAPCNRKVMQDMEAVLQELPDWHRVGIAYERMIGEEIKLRMWADPLRSLVFVERSMSATVTGKEASQEHVRQSQALKAFQTQCKQAVNEVFDRAYVRALERATRLLGDVQVERQYDKVNCVNSVRVLVHVTAN